MKYLIMSLFCLYALTAIGQRKITCKVVDKDTKKGIGDVMIADVHSSITTYTNFLGYFELVVADSITQLIASHISYQPIELNIPIDNQFQFSLSKTSIELSPINIRSDFYLKDYRNSYFSINDTLNNIYCAKFPLGDLEFISYLSQNLQLSDSLSDTIIQGSLDVLFDVNKSGDIENIEVSGDTLAGIGIKTVILFKNMDKWEPAIQNNKPCEQSFKVNIKYGREIFSVVDHPTKFPGAKYSGDLASFYEFVSEEIKYPEEARINDIDGAVYVQFTVNKHGQIVSNSVVVIKSLGYGLDDEAVRIIRKSPKWIAGSQKGNFIDQRVVLPIYFKK